MAGGETAPVVVAGLAVGIALVSMFSLHFTGNVPMFNERSVSDQISTIMLPSGVSCAGCQENFEPQTIRVVVGVNNTVRWMNNDLFPAMIGADNNDDPLFYTVTKDFVFLKPGESFEFTFTKPGEFGYHGKPWQHGSVIVVMPPAADK